MKEYFEAMKGQVLMIIGARYNYRGRVSVINDDSVILVNSTAVSEMGAADNEAPTHEDNVGTQIVSYGAIESVNQAPVALAPLPSEAKTAKNKK